MGNPVNDELNAFQAKALWDYWHRRVPASVRDQALMNQYDPAEFIPDNPRAFEIHMELNDPETTDARKVELLEELITIFRASFAP